EVKGVRDALASGPSARAATAVTRPPVVDSFVGRTVELRRALSLLAQNDCRLLTVSGPGGVGKTRMAQRILGECGSLFPDGATFIPLEDLTTIDELGGRIAGELEVKLKGHSDPLVQVTDVLRLRQGLLVFDNFEHLTDAASVLDRLLAECPRMKAVVTSRVRLGLANEWLLPLTGLPVPEPEALDELESFAAARLFIPAARRVDPSLNPAAEAAAIGEICRSVEGLPLALELAASWTRVLSCKDIAAELGHGAELLQSVDASRPARHASIEIVFEQ